MVATFKELAADWDTTTRAANYSYSLPTTAPAAGKFYILGVYQTAISNATGLVGSAAGWGLTWTKNVESSQDNTAVQTRDAAIFTASGTPDTSDDLNYIVEATGELSQLMWWVYEVDGVDLVDPVVQIYYERQTGGANVSINSPWTVPVQADSAAFGVFGVSANQGGTGPGAGIEVGAGWTESELYGTAPTHNGVAMYASDAPDAWTATWPVGANTFLAGIEIRASAGGGGPTNLDNFQYASGLVDEMWYNNALVDELYYGDTKVWP